MSRAEWICANGSPGITWGTKRVTIENILWADVDRSLAILRGRSKFKHVRRMIAEIEDRYRDLKKPVDQPLVAQAAPVAPRAEPVARRAEPVRVAARTSAPLTPFQATR